MQELLKKYFVIALPLIMVLILDIALLAINFFISSKLETTSANINIAGRQRMLTQKITKTVLLSSYYPEVDTYKKELVNAVTLFDQTLNSFANGGEVINAAGRPMVIAALANQRSLALVHQTLSIWQPIKQHINTFIVADKSVTNSSSILIEILSTHNITLLNSANQLTNQLEEEAKLDTYWLKGIQSLVVTMILISFGVVTARVIRRDRYFKELMEKSTDLILSIDVRSNQTTFVSASCRQLMNCDANYYLHQPVRLFFDEASATRVEKIITEVYKSGSLATQRCDVNLAVHDGQLTAAEIVFNLSKSEDKKNQEIHAHIRDITERKKAELALQQLAYKDVLTGLPNRNLFYELVENTIHLHQRHNKKLAILFLDLDGFKAINDRFGHAIGDKLLQAIATRISDCLRNSDTVARFGGDEFLILLPEINDQNHALDIGEKLITAMAETVLIDNHSCQVSASIGIALFPEHGENVKSLIKHADDAMYHVKHQGKNATRLFSKQ